MSVEEAVRDGVERRLRPSAKGRGGNMPATYIVHHGSSRWSVPAGPAAGVSIGDIMRMCRRRCSKADVPHAAVRKQPGDEPPFATSGGSPALVAN